MSSKFSLIVTCLALCAFFPLNASYPSQSDIARGEARAAHPQYHPQSAHPQGYHPQGYHPEARGFERGVEAGAAGSGAGVANPGYVAPYPSTTVIQNGPQTVPSPQPQPGQ